jgi:hypothetical protein
LLHDGFIQTTILIPQKMRDDVEKTGYSLSAFCRMALEEKLKNFGKKGKVRG